MCAPLLRPFQGSFKALLCSFKALLRLFDELLRLFKAIAEGVDEQGKIRGAHQRALKEP